MIKVVSSNVTFPLLGSEIKARTKRRSVKGKMILWWSKESRRGVGSISETFSACLVKVLAPPHL
jgi:hypothetical protein